VLANALAESHATDNAAQQIEDVGERRRALAVASRETRYFADRLRTAQVVPPPVEFGTVMFGHNVTFKRDDGSARPSGLSGNGSIPYVSPVAWALIGRAAGDIVSVGDREIEVLSIE
jgi:transcription elongation GreA/GreB family factor